ncbi:MAG: DNA polymerase III subunit delta' [Bacteroidota bacterium]|nr:DNA polymerase III subunit delta' [Bacteroidota bacterium]
MSWTKVLDQNRVKEILISSINRKRIAHAYLFSGAEGSGKYAMALELAKVLNCGQMDSQACDHCSNCQKIKSLQHPNLKIVFPLPVGKNEKSNDPPTAKLDDDVISLIHEQTKLKSQNPYHIISIPKANTIKINSIREIRREAALSLFGAGKKVFIIVDAEKMNEEASNALLKTLEEPHEDTLLILLTAYPDLLLQTIISRCQHIRFDPLSEETIQKALQGERGLEHDRAKAISRTAKSNYSRALQCIDNDLLGRQQFVVELFRVMLFKTRSELVGKIEEIMKTYKKYEIEEMLVLLGQWLNDAMKLSGGTIKGVGDESLSKFVVKYPRWNYSFSHESIERAVSLLNKNVYIPLILLDLTFKLKRCIDSPSGND